MEPQRLILSSPQRLIRHRLAGCRLLLVPLLMAGCWGCEDAIPVPRPDAGKSRDAAGENPDKPVPGTSGAGSTRGPDDSGGGELPDRGPADGGPNEGDGAPAPADGSGMDAGDEDAPADAGPADVSSPDASGGDSSTADAMPADAALTDAGNADGADAGPADSAVPDSSADSGPADSGATDSGSGDAAADGGPTDSGAGDGGTGGASWPADRLACFKANGWTFPPRSATGGKPAKDWLETNGWLETAGGWVPPPSRGPAQRIAKAEAMVVIGDSLAAGYNASPRDKNAYNVLIHKNNDALYPAFKGKDLSAAFPGIERKVNAESGAKADDVIANQIKGLPLRYGSKNLLVLINAGGNDAKAALTKGESGGKAAAAAYQKQLEEILGFFNDRSKFKGEVHIYLSNVYEFTDGVGDIHKTEPKCSNPNFPKFPVPWAKPVFWAFNEAVEAAAAKFPNVTIIRHLEYFWGHGIHHDDKSNACYVADDPTMWFDKDCTHGVNRGHHEIRRLYLRAITGME